jgi:hypothetical protein
MAPEPPLGEVRTTATSSAPAPLYEMATGQMAFPERQLAG